MQDPNEAASKVFVATRLQPHKLIQFPANSTVGFLMSVIGEPKHTAGHSTEITQNQDREFMCPECGRTFEIKDAAEKHLHTVHLKHLRSVHGEVHGEDVDTIHVG
jgi:predicted RNA-binding Zn-ribbon protein involved in translation (DUF1610 family)